MTSPNVGKLSEALSKAQAEMQHAIKDSTNPHFKSKYADLASVIDALRPALTKYGLSVAQTMKTENGMHFLVTTLMHTSGEFIEGSIPLLLDKPNMQGLGSALTYARRYGLAAMVGIHQEDDDANLASGPAPRIEKQNGPQMVRNHPTPLATVKQVEFCRKLFKDLGLGTQEIKDMLKPYGVTKGADLNMDQISDLIDKLKIMAIKEEQGSFDEMPGPAQLITKVGEEF